MSDYFGSKLYYVGVILIIFSAVEIVVSLIIVSFQHAGTAIRPHMSDLVCCMLESLSSLEDQGLNYVEVWLNDIFNSCIIHSLILVHSKVLCYIF